MHHLRLSYESRSHLNHNRMLSLPLVLGLGLSLGVALDARECRAAPGEGRKDPRVQAKLHFERGTTAYKAGRYQEAHDEFLQSYNQAGLPDLLYNLAVTAERMGRPDLAVGYLEKYLTGHPPDRQNIESELRRLRRRGGKELDQDLAGRTPAPEPARITAPSAPAEPIHKAPVPLTGEVGQRRGPPVAALALLGGGAAVLAVGIGLGVGAASAASELNSLPSGMPYNKDLERRGKALEAAGIALDVLGGVALGAGAAWTGVWAYRNRRGARVSVVPAGLGLGLAGGF